MEDRPEKLVIIGAGVGGLASAMRLAHAGMDVTVVETHNGPGGKMRTVESPAGPVDAGPTVLTMRSVFEELFEDLGERLENHVTLLREPLLARHWWPDGSALDLFDDPERSAEAVRDFAGPRAEAEFRAFTQSTTRLFDAFEAPLMRTAEPSILALAKRVLRNPGLIPAMAPLQTMAATLARDFTDPRLRQLFGRYATYVGGSPFEAPGVLRLICQAEARGVWRVAGGMHNLARAMADLAIARGVVFRYGNSATRIEWQGGRPSAVHLANGERLAANRILFNGDPRALAQGHLGDTARSAVRRTHVEPRSLSANVWAFAARALGRDLAHHNVFFGSDPHTEFDPISKGHMPEDPTLYVCAQDRGGEAAPPETERFEIIMNAPPASGDQTEDIRTCRTRTFPVLARRGLRFSPEPPDSALTTPKGFDALFPASQGSLYGRSPHGAMAAFARPKARTGLPGLYLVGGGTHPGAGVPMAALSGQHAAEAILTDLASTSTSPRTAMRGGMSTASRTAAPARSRSSPS